jgi:hypothetical protein
MSQPLPMMNSAQSSQPPAATTVAPRAARLGGPAQGGWSQAVRHPRTPATRSAACPPAGAAGPRHVASATGTAIVPIEQPVPAPAGRLGCREPSGLSRRPLLRSAGSSASPRRGGRARCLQIGDPGPRGALCVGDQPRSRPARAGLGPPVSRASAPDTARGARGSGLRVAQPPKAPARRSQHRPMQFGTLVPGLAATSCSSRGSTAGSSFAHMAGEGGLAARRASNRCS